MVGGVGGPGGGGKVGGPGAPAPAPPAAPEVERTGGPSGAKFAERLERASGAAPAEGPAPLERLRRGEIDATAYVEARVKDAIAHLEGVLPADDLERVRAELRDLIENDPDVAALVKTAEVGS